MVAKYEEDRSKKNIVYTIQACLFVIALITMYFNVPSNLRYLTLLGVAGVFAIVYIILEIFAIREELNFLKKKMGSNKQR